MSVHTLILGAGAAGLAAAYRLAAAGAKPVVLEREPYAGGLMRSLRRGPFIVDLGRKELYSRNHRVDRFWTEILGSESRPYRRRFASLYGRHIIEHDAAYKGIRRGMPWWMFLTCLADLGWSRLRYRLRRPRTYQEYMYRTSGRRFSRIMSQGFWEKINRRRWSDMPAPTVDGVRYAPLGSLMETWSRALSVASARASHPVWRHPAKGTGQICERLEARTVEAGGRFEFGATVTAMTSTGDAVATVTATTATGTVTFRPQHVIASLSAHMLARWLDPATPADRRPPVEGRRATRLVYLMFDAPPRFPHAWLEVSNLDMRAGRITNFAGFGGEMVPPGQCCLCVEFFCAAEDPLLAIGDDDLTMIAMRECAEADLADPDRCIDTLAVTLPGADAAINLRSWRAEVEPFLAALRPIHNLYYVNRPSTDQATFAGLLAADAVLTGSRTQFDETPWG